MMKRNELFDLLKPIVVLTIICVVAAGLLGLVNAATAPVIEGRKEAAILEKRQEFFPNATAFTEIDCDIPNVVSVHEADTGGYIITVNTGGYNGTFPVTVGIDKDGVVVGVSADVSGETANKGTLAGDAEYVEKFIGLEGSAKDVDLIAGATISSRAVRDGVDLALKVYSEISEGVRA